jgi:hypothetical protein
MINIEELSVNLINAIEQADIDLGVGDRCTAENEAIAALKTGLNSLPEYPTCYYPLHNSNKWKLATIINGPMKDTIVSIVVVFLDLQCIVELPNNDGYINIDIKDLHLWQKVECINTNK